MWRELRLRRTPLTHDVVVLGGGPAGCAAAGVLARGSHRVALVRPDTPPAGALAESVPPSAHRILTELGFLDAVRAGRFHPNRGNTVWWAGDEPRTESFPDERTGLHTDRARLESVLSGAVERVGVEVLAGTSAREVTEGPEGWTVRCIGADSDRTLRAPWVVDATGRRGVLARGEGRETDRDTTTLAIVRRWRHPDGWPTAAEGHTLVESCPEGWAWSVPLSSHLRCMTMMLDQRAADFEGDDLDAVLDRELGRTVHLRPMLDGARPEGAAWACPASLYTARPFARPGLVLAGDAGSFIDPLSSFGVKKALSSGWLAGVVIHSCLTDPTMLQAAVDFFDARERAVYRSFRAASADFFERAEAFHRTEYWSARAEAARAVVQPPSGSGPDTSAAPIDFGDPLEPPVPEDDVRAAFERIRSREALRARPGATLRTLARPGIQGDRLAMRDHLASDRVPSGLRFVRGVDLTKLVAVVPGHADVPEGWSAYNGVAPPVTLPDYLTALATAFAAGLLEHAEDAG